MRTARTDESANSGDGASPEQPSKPAAPVRAVNALGAPKATSTGKAAGSGKAASAGKAARASRPPKADATPKGAKPVEAPEAETRKAGGSRAPFLRRGGLLATVVRSLILLAGLVLTVVFAVALARVTLVPEPAARNLVHPNFRLGASLRGYLDQPAVRAAIQQVGGNVLLGAPFGVLLPVLFPRMRSVLAATALTALVMVTVEAAQGFLVVGRAFDVDDVVLNTAGALLGHLLLGRRLGRALYRPS
ncbi:VanZ family protein [Streptomyces sp. TLI_171]|uniref:VanZ family protein n=1 Tax=Streptomyces sp. TLI_171 TaxID=1938859 RepID=UPI000C37B908|nr:VanZ family protein [Streptomyces sp. TLI_171]RKE23096.1 glycopeptide antibiotics resistance protein [Streptomyces sp. TLI_171]